jgi:hypothetical protein
VTPVAVPADTGVPPPAAEAAGAAASKAGGGLSPTVWIVGLVLIVAVILGFVALR